MTDLDHETITVMELPLASVFGVYEQHGYDAGYRRAVRDVSLSLLEMTENVIRQRGLDASLAADLRRAAWALQETLLQRHAESAEASAAADVFVENGLGI